MKTSPLTEASKLIRGFNDHAEVCSHCRKLLKNIMGCELHQSPQPKPEHQTSESGAKNVLSD
jgi:hypothetical protein